MNMFFRKEFSSVGNVTSDNLVLRDITIWSSVLVKGIYVTNTCYNRENIPKEIIAIRQSEDVKLRYMEAPEGEAGIQEDYEEDKDYVPNSPRKSYSKKVFQERFDESLNEIEKRSKELHNENLKKNEESPSRTQMRRLEKELEQVESHKSTLIKSSLELKEANSEILKKNVKFSLFRWKA
jgi:hypothetical protein